MVSVAADADVVRQFVTSLMGLANDMGFLLSKNPHNYAIPNNRTQTYVEAVKDAVAKKPDMIMIFLPNNKVRMRSFGVVLLLLKCLPWPDRDLPRHQEDPVCGHAGSVASHDHVQAEES